MNRSATRAPGVAFGIVPLLVLCLALADPGSATAQGLSFSNDKSDAPMEVFADDGIEWEQDRKVFTARGNARAVRGEVTVAADVLRAYYREKEGGGADIWRLDAEGHVKISSPGETAYGDSAVYDVDNAILVLSGRRVRLVTEEDEITADRQLEYWEKKQMAVARGNASAVRGDKKLRADVLSAHFRKGKDGDTKIYRVDAYENVHIVTETDVVTADRGVYEVESGIATLTGSVRLTRDNTQLNGCSAEVNLKTGVSNLRSCAQAGSGKGRVQGIFQPDSVKKN